MKKIIKVFYNLIRYPLNLVEIALTNLPNAIESANLLKDKKEAIQEKKEQMNFTVDSLRRNINLCRETLNK